MARSGATFPRPQISMQLPLTRLAGAEGGAAESLCDEKAWAGLRLALSGGGEGGLSAGIVELGAEMDVGTGAVGVSRGD